MAFMRVIINGESCYAPNYYKKHISLVINSKT